MARTVLLTLGRMPKCLDLARGFHALGRRVVVAEPFAWHLCRASRAVAKSVRVPAPARDAPGYRAALGEVIAAEGVDLVVPVSEELLYVAALRDTLPEGVALHSPPQATVLELHDKLRFAQKIRALGLPAPETHPADSAAARALAARAPVVVKPRNSCAGLGVSFHGAGALPGGALSSDLVVQERKDGRVLSSFSLVAAGRVRVTSVYRGVVMSGTVAVCFERLEAQAAIERFVEEFSAKTGYSGFLSFDFVEAADGSVTAIECNPRVTSGLHFLEAADVARAIADPGGDDPVRFRPERLMQQFYPCLIEAEAALFTRKEPGLKWRARRSARDVTWDRADPLVFPTMTFTSYPILVPAIFKGKSMAETATEDLAWREELPMDMPEPA